MRKWARIGVLAAIMAGSAGLAGCHHTHDRHGLAYEPVEHQARAAPRARKVAAKRSVVKRVARPEPVNAGARVRHFCGQRHIRFQRGQLQESANEKARNNELCRQEYRG